MDRRDNKIYNRWLASPYVSNEMKEEMKKMSEEQVFQSFKDEPLKFGTAGYRAIYGPGPMFLNEFTYKQLTVAYAKFLLANKKDENKQLAVFVGHDNRRDGKIISMRIAEILTSFGIKVYLIKNNWLVATPIVSYIIRKLGLDGALNITASHNPKDYNGFKAYNSTGAQVSNEEAEQISKLLPNSTRNISAKYQPNNQLINFIDRDIIEAYYDDITNDLDWTDYENFYKPVIVTPHHGAGCVYLQDYLESLGHNVIMVEEQSFEDPNFQNSPNMNPEEPASFEKAKELAEEYDSDIMLGLDPDADRMAVAIKHKGEWRYLNGNEVGILATYYLLKNKQYGDKVPVVVSTYVSNTMINRIVEHFDGLVIRTATGFKNIAQAMDLIDPYLSEYIVGFEEAVGLNGSLTTREKDGIFASALILEMYNYYKQQNQDLVDILENRIYQSFGKWYGETISLKIEGSDWKEKAKDLEKIALTIPEGTKIGNFVIEDVFWNSEGSCIEWNLNNDSWIKFRISGTEPKFKIYYNLFFEDDGSFSYDYKGYKTYVQKLTNNIKERLFKHVRKVNSN